MKKSLYREVQAFLFCAKAKLYVVTSFRLV